MEIIMDTDRSNILAQLAAGQISADEAAQRLRPSAGTPQGLSLSGRWLHIRVTDLDSGRQKVNVNLPLAWVEVGMKIGARYQPEIAGFDINALVQQIHVGAEGKLIEVEDLEDNERVEIFVD
jgi:hypothetical protein